MVGEGEREGGRESKGSGREREGLGERRHRARVIRSRWRERATHTEPKTPARRVSERHLETGESERRQTAGGAPGGGTWGGSLSGG